VEVTLTATITSGAVSDTRDWLLKVKAKVPAWVFAHSDFEEPAVLSKHANTTYTYDTAVFYGGNQSLHVVHAHTGSAVEMIMNTNCIPKESYTKIGFWIKGSSKKHTGSGNGGSISIQLSSGDFMWNLGSFNGSKTVDTYGQGNYVGEFDVDWVKITLTGIIEPSRFAVRGANLICDFYIDEILYE
jgi:hypothetical protein